MTSLNERLGYAPGEKIVIVSCDDLGMSHAANLGVYASLREGWASSASLMVPGPWARAASAEYRGEDVGVHLTLNAEFELFKWGPLTRAPSLFGGDGGFPRGAEDTWEHADLDEVRLECRAQIDRAIYWGFDVTHIDSHLGALILRPEFFDIALDMAVDFRLPLRLPAASAETSVGFPFRELATREGVLSPDRVIFFPRIEALEPALQSLRPGVTELVFCPAFDTPELRAISPDWGAHVAQLNALTTSSLIPDGVRRISYRALRDVQRQAA